MNRPNLLMIVAHDLGDYLGCYGTPVRTPHLDALARDGVLLENHLAAAPTEAPSRASLMTGCYPHTHGVLGPLERGWQLDVEGCPPLPLLLRSAGYETHLFGFEREHLDPSRLGYQQVHDLPTYFAEDVADAAASWLEGQTARSQLFFAMLGPAEAHRLKLNPSGWKRDVYVPADPAQVAVRPELPDVPEVRAELADFYGAIAHLDQAMGRVLAALDRSGLARNTLVLFTSDNGASFPHGKGTLYDGGLKVALLARWPGVIPAGRRIAALTSHVDLAPTLLNALELPAPRRAQGENLLGRPRSRAYVYGEMNHDRGLNPTRMIRSARHKYIERRLNHSIYDGFLVELELSPLDFRGHPAIFDHYPARRCREELYDLATDPGELRNLAEDEANAGLLREMKAALYAHLDRTTDRYRTTRLNVQIPTNDYEDVRAARRGRQP